MYASLSSGNKWQIKCLFEWLQLDQECTVSGQWLQAAGRAGAEQQRSSVAWLWHHGVPSEGCLLKSQMFIRGADCTEEAKAMLDLGKISGFTLSGSGLRITVILCRVHCAGEGDCIIAWMSVKGG